MRRAVVALACLALAAGCSGASLPHPLIPRQVLHPALSHAPVLGVDLYATASYPLAQVRAYGERDIGYLARTLGVQSVGIAWNLYSPGYRSDVTRAGRGSLSPAAVALLTQIAYSYHLSVEYRPLVKVGPHARWEGPLDPGSPPRWFAGYYRAELPYLRTAQRLHVGEFVAETELTTLGHSALWGGFFRRAGRVYHGLLSYAAFEGSFFSPSGDILPTQVYGLDAYPRLPLPPTATVGQLVAGWVRYLSRATAATLARTAVDEIGIPALTTAYSQPWRWVHPHGRYDQAVQANWYTAACIAVARMHMRGIYFWNANLRDNPLHPPWPDYPAFEGKRGALAIRGCLRIFGGR